MKTRLMIVVAVAAVAVACHDGGEGPGGGPEELRLTGAIKGEVVARGAAAGDVIAAGEVVHAWVDEAVNPAVAHVKAWRLEADGNGGLDGTTCYFPDRTYGDVTFPAGNYKTLRIELGDAAGHNWWCVLYPNLCFLDTTNAVLPEKGKQQLKKVLTEEEYSEVTAGSKFQIRWFFWKEK